MPYVTNIFRKIYRSCISLSVQTILPGNEAFFTNAQICTRSCKKEEDKDIYYLTYGRSSIFQQRGSACEEKRYHQVFAVNAEGQRYHPDYLSYEIDADDIKITIDA